MSDRTIKWGGAAAILFVVLILITAFGAGQPPMADDSVDKIRAYLVDHRTALLVFNAIGLFAVPFVLWFAVVLREVLRGDQTSNALGTASLAGLILTASMALAGGALQVAPIYVSGVAEGLNGDVLRIIFEAQNLLFAATSAGIIVFTLGAGLAIRRTNALPAHTMWLAFLAVIGNLATMFSTVGAKVSGFGFAGLLSFALFLLVTGITMVISKATPAVAAA
jgi:hypothetical protein